MPSELLSADVFSCKEANITQNHSVSRHFFVPESLVDVRPKRVKSDTDVNDKCAKVQMSCSKANIGYWGGRGKNS